MVASSFDNMDLFILHEILKHMNLEDLANFCLTSKTMNEALCKCDNFWRVKFDNDFSDYKEFLGEDYELQGNNWKDKYMNAIEKFVNMILFPEYI